MNWRCGPVESFVILPGFFVFQEMNILGGICMSGYRTGRRCSSLLAGMMAVPSIALAADAAETGEKLNYADVGFMAFAALMVFFMTPALGFFYGGMVGKRNVISTMLQSFIALGVISILWVVVGFSLSFGESIGFTINTISYSFLIFISFS